MSSAAISSLASVFVGAIVAILVLLAREYFDRRREGYRRLVNAHDNALAFANLAEALLAREGTLTDDEISEVFRERWRSLPPVTHALFGTEVMRTDLAFFDLLKQRRSGIASDAYQQRKTEWFDSVRGDLEQRRRKQIRRT